VTEVVLHAGKSSYHPTNSLKAPKKTQQASMLWRQENPLGKSSSSSNNSNNNCDSVHDCSRG